MYICFSVAAGEISISPEAKGTLLKNKTKQNKTKKQANKQQQQKQICLFSSLFLRKYKLFKRQRSMTKFVGPQIKSTV